MFFLLLFFFLFLFFLMKTKSNPTVSHQLELVGVVSWTWVGLGFDNKVAKVIADTLYHIPLYNFSPYQFVQDGLGDVDDEAEQCEEG